MFRTFHFDIDHKVNKIVFAFNEVGFIFSAIIKKIKLKNTSLINSHF